jgi:Uncharacterised nucleotidyltransferase
MNPSQPSPTVVSFGEDVLDRMVLAVELVKQRLQRATAALESAEIKYAVIGGNAVAAWVAQVDPAAARNTVDVDLLVDRADFEKVKTALASAGFVYRHAKGVDLFLDGPMGKPREAVHIVFAGEKVRKEYVAAAPGLNESIKYQSFNVLAFDAIVRMKLTSFRLKDQVHLQDMIEVGLLNYLYLDRLQPELAVRLKELLDHPEA